MKTYKYVDATNRVVHIIDEDGLSRESCEASSLDAGLVILPADPPSVAETVAEITIKTQERLDVFARTRNYDGILSACTYATSTVPKFSVEGQAAVNARDATWATLYTIMGAVQAGTRSMPSSFADVEPDLPALVWPA